MKTVLITLVAALALGTLLGCNHRQATVQSASLEPMKQSYSGLLPCGPRCQESESSLFLAADGSYVLEQKQVGAAGMRVAQYGKWARTADTLTLVALNGEKQRFRPTESGLEAVGRSGTTFEPHRYHLAVSNPARL